MKRINILLIAAYLCSFEITIAGEQPSPASLPNGRGVNYSSVVDYSISDEFDAESVDWSKWGRRNTKGLGDFIDDESLVVMEREKGANYLSIKATAKGGGLPRTAGLVSRSTGYFGLYTLRFRLRGLDQNAIGDKRYTIWHPSVWCAKESYIKGAKRGIDSPNEWLEIDFMEWETQHNGWACDAPAYFIDSSGKERKVVTKGAGIEKAILTDAIKHIDGEWCTVVLEYTPEYLRIWEWRDGKLVDLNKHDVNFVEHNTAKPEECFSTQSISKRVAQPSFWILGNLVSPHLYERLDDPKYTKYDMSMDIDFFRYYPHKSVEDRDWSWRNGKQ